MSPTAGEVAPVEKNQKLSELKRKTRSKVENNTIAVTTKLSKIGSKETQQPSIDILTNDDDDSLATSNDVCDMNPEPVINDVVTHRWFFWSDESSSEMDGKGSSSAPDLDKQSSMGCVTLSCSWLLAAEQMGARTRGG